MLGFLNDIREFFALVFGLGNWLLFGAFLVALGGLLRPWAGLVSCAAAGAVLMFLAITQHWLADDGARVDRLEAELKAKTAQLEISKATTKALQKSFMEEAEAAEHNRGVIETLQNEIDTLEDKPDCGVSEDFIDALKDIR